MSEFNLKKYLANNPLLNEIELKYRSEDYIFDYIANDLFREKYGRTIAYDELTDEEKDRVENSYDSYVDEDEPSGFYDRGMDVDESINEELDHVHVYDKNNKKIIGTGRVVQPEKDNPYSVLVQFDHDRDLILSFPRDRVKPVKEEVNEMDLRKGDVVKFKDGSRIIIVGPKGDGFDYVDGKDGKIKGHHPAKWFAKMLSTGKAVLSEGLMDDIFGGIPYKTVGVVSFTTVALPDDVKERIIGRAEEAGKVAKPNITGGVTVRDEAALTEEEELTFIPSSGTKAGGTFELNNRKYELTSPVKDVTIGGRYITDLPKGTILYNLAGGLLADHESLRKFETRSNQYFDKDNYSGIMIRKDKEVLQNIIDNSKVLEFYES